MVSNNNGIAASAKYWNYVHCAELVNLWVYITSQWGSLFIDKAAHAVDVFKNYKENP